MLILRDAAYTVAAAASSPVWGWKLLRTGKYRTDWRERFGYTAIAPSPLPSPQGRGGKPTILIHAVSVGEVNATRLLIDKLLAAHGGEWRIVVSVTTNTGIERARQLFTGRCEVVRFPFDFSRSVARFLNRVRPDVVALVELELWPNFVELCNKRDIPLCVINGRLSARSFRGYRRFRPLMRGTFASLAAVGVQDQTYAERFEAMGTPAQRVTVMGTMKWDNAVIADDVPGADALAEAMGIDRSRPLVVCGSTGPGEEKLFVEHLPGVGAGVQLPGVQLMIVPRKPERFEEVATAMGGSPVRRSKHPDGTKRPPDGARLFLLDTMGELHKAWALADVAVVGRSFSPQWGSDMTEPIALGKPTVVGPNTADFTEQMGKLLAGGGIVQVSGLGELADVVQELLSDHHRAGLLAEAGRAVILANQGATRRYVELIERLMTRRNKPLSP